MDVEKYRFYQDLIALPFVEAVWLFGSRARKDHQSRADIDLAVLCPSATLQDWQKLQKIIENADTLLKIDCIRFDIIDSKNVLRNSILNQGIKLYEKL
jgi:predicted nucleotidyltransferase